MDALYRPSWEKVSVLDDQQVASGKVRHLGVWVAALTS
jgi:hypothetical protein